MVNNVNEELSALMDGEASELEMHRVLKQVPGDDGELLSQWQRMHLARAAIRGEFRGADASWSSLDITSSVSAAIEQEPAHSIPYGSASKEAANQGTWWQEAVVKPMASIAIAASVSAMVVFGWQSFQQPGQSVGNEAFTAQTASARSQGATVVNQAAQSPFLTVAQGDRSEGAPQSSPSQVPQHEIIRMPASQNERLKRYLISHSGNAASIQQTVLCRMRG